MAATGPAWLTRCVAHPIGGAARRRSQILPRVQQFSGAAVRVVGRGKRGRLFSEHGGEPGQGTAAAARAGLAFQPGHGGWAYSCLVGQFFLGQAALAAQLPKPVTIHDRGPLVGRAGAPNAGRARVSHGRIFLGLVIGWLACAPS